MPYFEPPNRLTVLCYHGSPQIAPPATKRNVKADAPVSDTQLAEIESRLADGGFHRNPAAANAVAEALRGDLARRGNDLPARERAIAERLATKLERLGVNA